LRKTTLVSVPASCHRRNAFWPRAEAACHISVTALLERC
jgi:hypothetical protein